MDNTFFCFWFDATLTLFRRYRNSEKLSQAHKKHGYQRLMQSGYAHDKVVIIAMCINIILFGLVYSVSNIFLATILSIVLLYTSMKLVDRKKAFE